MRSTSGNPAASRSRVACSGRQIAGSTPRPSGVTTLGGSSSSRLSGRQDRLRRHIQPDIRLEPEFVPGMARNRAAARRRDVVHVEVRQPRLLRLPRQQFEGGDRSRMAPEAAAGDADLLKARALLRQFDRARDAARARSRRRRGPDPAPARRRRRTPRPSPTRPPGATRGRMRRAISGKASRAGPPHGPRRHRRPPGSARSAPARRPRSREIPRAPGHGTMPAAARSGRGRPDVKRAAPPRPPPIRRAPASDPARARSSPRAPGSCRDRRPGRSPGMRASNP